MRDQLRDLLVAVLVATAWCVTAAVAADRHSPDKTSPLVTIERHEATIYRP